MGAVIRLINAKIPSFEELDLPAILKEVALTKRGLVMIVGGTGSGKSTSLAAMIGHRNENTSITSSRSRIRSSTCTTIRVA